MIQVIRNRTRREYLSPDTNRLIITGAGSIDDDFHRFQSRLKMGQRQDEEVKFYQFILQTDGEFELWKRLDLNYLRNFQIESTLDEEEFKKSDSDKIYARNAGARLTMFKIVREPARTTGCVLI